jgi:hypothetical protein
MNTTNDDLEKAPMDQASEQRLKELLRGAVKEPEEGAVPDVLGGVQRKLRARSGGKFYDDVWSTARHTPVTTYFITSLLMLFVLAVAYFILRPLSGQPEPVRNQPAPVEIIAPLPHTPK